VEIQIFTTPQRRATFISPTHFQKMRKVAVCHLQSSMAQNDTPVAKMTTLF
jgi:hypothetical protein